MIRFFLTVCALCLFAFSASAQEPADAKPAAPEVESESLTASTQAVSVEDAVGDEAIERRILDILEAVGAFDSPDVRVREGVAFLTGTVRKPELITWAKDLAMRTEGVVAVVNDIKLEQRSIWDMTPAKEELLSLGRELVRSLPLFLLGLFALIVTVFASRGLARLVVAALPSKFDNQILRVVVEKAAYALVLILGMYVFLRISGLTRIALTLVGGTGIAGLVLGLAFRDIAENFLASLLISIQRPFKIGDTIEVAGNTGVVQRVTTRGTILMDFDGNHIQLSNSTVYKGTIRNFTANPKLRVTFTVGVGYDTGIAEAQAVIGKVLDEHSAILKEPAARVLVESLGSATINLRIYAWIDGHEHSKQRVESSLMRISTSALIDAGISLPDEAREVVFPNGVPVIQMSETSKASSAAAPKPKTPRLDEQEERQAEGSLESEVQEIHEQAMSSPMPEEGADIL